MHTQPMSESDGTFQPAQDSGMPCRKCKSGPVEVKAWESSCGGYEDYKYTCAACGHVWWVDGIDS